MLGHDNRREGACRVGRFASLGIAVAGGAKTGMSRSVQVDDQKIDKEKSGARTVDPGYFFLVQDSCLYCTLPIALPNTRYKCILCTLDESSRN